uniref:Divergent protein kinase domain 2B n=1 Tax=Petromyzon marinus TaxID=7757 RepID=A0AAJ7XAX4_PETMA|nr:divergent protein kinase domain 2B [Petromyzon marinus]
MTTIPRMMTTIPRMMMTTTMAVTVARRWGGHGTGPCAWLLVAASAAATAATLGVRAEPTGTSQALGGFCEVDKCDLCLGTSLCPQILSGDVVIEEWSPAQPGPAGGGYGGGRSRRTPGDRTHYRGLHRNEGEPWRVVEAARPLERPVADALEVALCARRNATGPCDSARRRSPRLRRWTRAKRLTVDLVQGLRSPLLACPSQRLLDRIVRRFAEASDGGSVFMHHLDERDRLRLLFTLAASPQLVLQQIFPMQEGWPFARYFGACGRLAVSVGTVPLAHFVGGDAERSADLAYQALTITAGMTSNDFGYLLYFTEMHGAVFGVRCDGQLRIADARVVGVFDQKQPSAPPTTTATGFSDDIFSTLSPPSSSHPPSTSCSALPSAGELEARNVALVCHVALRPLLTGAFHSPQGLQHQVDSLLALCADSAMGPRVVTQAAAWLCSLLDSLRPCRPDFPYRYPECRYGGGGL